ncbi:FG-GAP repeat domain-containing protein [Kitasatospora sp. NPDC001660]
MSAKVSRLVRIALAAVVAASGAIATTTLTATAAHAVGTSSTGGAITRSEIIARAQSWVDENVPYDQYHDWADSNGTYRQDCSGLVSMAWHIDTSATNYGFTTQTMDKYATRLGSLDDLRQGDAINNISAHTVLFDRWTDSSHTTAMVYEEAHPGTNARYRAMDRSEMTSGGFLPFRYSNVLDVTLHYSQTAAADFTGDGKADIIARDDSTGNLMMWVHDAGGSYNAPKVVTGGWNFTETTVSDFNADGKADIVAKGSDGSLYMWYGNGDGTFGAPHVVTGGWNFTQTAAADFDGDGKADLIAKGADGNLYMWPGHGDGTFGAPHVQTGGWNYTETRAADFNGDGKADIVARDSNGNLVMWPHSSNGSFGTAQQITSGWNFSQTAAADIDGNGKTDLIGRDDTTGNLMVWAGNGDGTFARPYTLTSGW